MKIFSGTLGLILLALVLCFALSNQQSVTVGFWPLPGMQETPLYLVGLMPFISGLLLGGFYGWLSGLPHRRRAHHLHQELEELSEKIESLQHAAVDHHVSKKHHLWPFKSHKPAHGGGHHH